MDKSKKVIKTLKRTTRRNPKAKLEIKEIIKRIEFSKKQGCANTEYARILTESLIMLGITNAISREDFLELNELGRECAFE